MMPSYREHPPTPVDADYEYTSQGNGNAPTPTPTSNATRDWQQARRYEKDNYLPPPRSSSGGGGGGETTGEEALLDLVQLEELHQEAERMKALGNKHMAAQEFTRAYNAYSAALQLSPVGPSSHVFLSNRAAALLSLKRYDAAATDAKRAIALAPTFGKAHARLGQALYFQKDYPGAVAAYQDAISYEPDNAVTLTYLQKAQAKWEKQQRKARGEEVSVADTNTHFTGQAASVVTDVHKTNVVQSGGYRGSSSEAVMAAANRTPPLPSMTSSMTPTSLPPPTALEDLDMEDPDLEEALKIQQRANRYLANKQYKYAIEEYTAALFLVPDDPQLSPDLHLGRAHALNGSRRHESAKNDAMLAIKLAPTPAAYSTLAKSLFYMKDYHGAIDAFTKCQAALPKGETLGMFDRAYLQKAEAAVEEASASLSMDQRSRTSRSTTPVPKLKPPRFVPREEAMQQTHNVPRMPKQWPQQIPSSPTALQCGPEREIVFLSEALGIKLNRGSDGIVRVLGVTPHTAGSPVARDGVIEVGDVIREAAGVDIRRPITNVMWGDTVALVKMAPRPITMMVAKELSEVPPSVLEEQKRASPSKTSMSPGFRPSPANGDESVGEVNENEGVVSGTHVEDVTSEHVVEELPASHQDIPETAEMSLLEIMEKEAVDVIKSLADNLSDAEGVDDSLRTEDPDSSKADALTDQNQGTAAAENEDQKGVEESPVSETEGSPEARKPGEMEGDGASETNVEVPDASRKSTRNDESAQTVSSTGEPNVQQTTERDSEREKGRFEESRIVGGDVIFDGSPSAYSGWDSLRWMSYSGVRKVKLFQHVFRYEEKPQKTLFWAKVDKEYLPRVLAIYEEPSLILVLRRPVDEEELLRLVGSSDTGGCWVVESVVDPTTCKLQLSNLTHRTSTVDVEQSDERSRSLFEIISPTEKIRMSAVRLRDELKRGERSFTDSVAFFETNSAESSLLGIICDAHSSDGDVHDGSLLQHQVVLGTLHAYVLSGNTKSLEAAVERARRHCYSTYSGKEAEEHFNRVLNGVDRSERPALFYACARKMSSAASLLVSSGAQTDYRTPDQGLTLLHVCASNLDDRGLAALLAAPGRFKIDSNALDSLGRTSMFTAAIIGKTSMGSNDPDALGRCLEILHSHGGELLVDLPRWMQHPVSILSSTFRVRDLSAVLRHVAYRFPINNADGLPVENSLASLYDYPMHSAMLAFMRIIDELGAGKSVTTNVDLPEVVKTLLSYGFEPNERLDDSKFSRRAGLRYIGYSPLQLLALAALRLNKIGSTLEQSVYGRLDTVVSTTASALVSNGARITLDAPPGQRFKANGGVELGKEEEALRSQLKLDANQNLLHLLGGVALLSKAQTGWATKTNVPADPAVMIQVDNSIVLENARAPGGTSDKSCAICWKQFGLLVRKHKCRVSWRYVCDECTTKRIVRDGSHRVSDGQFLLACADAARAVSERQKRDMEWKQEAQKSSQANSTSMAKLDMLEAEDEANRNTLFGSAMEQAASYVFGEQDQPTQTSDGVSGLVATMGETRNALLDRGEKLSSLNDKSAKMVDASANFASMAKELRKKSEQGLFW